MRKFKARWWIEDWGVFEQWKFAVRADDLVTQYERGYDVLRPGTGKWELRVRPGRAFRFQAVREKPNRVEKGEHVQSKDAETN